MESRMKTPYEIPLIKWLAQVTNSPSFKARARSMSFGYAVMRIVGIAYPTERAGPFGQRSGSAGHDPIGVAISHVPEEQCLGAVVSNPYQERARHSQARSPRLVHSP